RLIGIIFAFTILCQQRLRCFTFGWNYENPKQWLRRTGALKGDLFPVRRPVRHGRDHGWIRELCAFATVNPAPPKSPIRKGNVRHPLSISREGKLSGREAG